MRDPKSLIKPGNEDSEQIAVMAWAAKHAKAYPCLQWLHHIPNGGTRNKIEAGRLKAMGVRRGICDLFLPFPSRGYHGLVLEMKHEATGLSDAAKASMVSTEQKNYLDYCAANGYACGVAYGYDEAVRAISWYLMMEELADGAGSF